MAIDGQKLVNFLYLVREQAAGLVLYLIRFVFVRIYLILLLILNSANWLLAYYINRNVSQELVILHYNVNLGVNLIGPVRDVYTIPALGLAFIIINFLLLLNVYLKDKFAIHLLLGFSLLINLFLFAGTMSVYLINFR
ncbi:MAG: hypothetical protein Q8O93_01325 [bacterium]|nr:hypothetical protein [bacterium]